MIIFAAGGMLGAWLTCCALWLFTRGGPPAVVSPVPPACPFEDVPPPPPNLRIIEGGRLYDWQRDDGVA